VIDDHVHPLDGHVGEVHGRYTLACNFATRVYTRSPD
jgi:hypothetical protein